MTISKHGLERMKERGGFGKSGKQMLKIATRAYEKGVGYGDASGKLKNFMKKKMLCHGSSYILKIYGGYLFIFGNDTLITMYPVPGKLLAG